MTRLSSRPALQSRSPSGSRSLGAIGLASTLLLSGAYGVARADDAVVVADPGIVANADRLFHEGQQLLQAGSVSAACASFAESERVDPKLGRLLNLANCHEREGKTASAWVEFGTAVIWASQKGQKDREDFAREHAGKLEKTLSLLRIDLAGAKDAAAITVDGTPIAKDHWALPIPVDPGNRTITVTTPEKKPIEIAVFVAPGPTTQVVTLPPFEDEVKLAPAPLPAEPAPALVVAPPPPPPRVEEPPPPHSKRTIAIVAGGAGVVALGLGTYFGLAAASKKSDANPHCPAKSCDPTGLALIADAKTDATVATVAFVAGVVGIGAGAYFLWADGASRGGAMLRLSPAVGLGHAGLRMDGAW